MLLIFLHLFIAFNHLGGGKKFTWTLTVQFEFFFYLLMKILEKLIVGSNNYNLSNLICFSVISQKSKSELHKNIIVMERFILESNSFWPNLKANNFAKLNLAHYPDLCIIVISKSYFIGDKIQPYGISDHS